MRYQLLQPTACSDPAQDLRGNQGSFLWFDGANVNLVVAAEGHSIKSIKPVVTVPEAIGSFNRSGTLVKISDTDLSNEYYGDGQRTTQQRN